MKHERLCTPLAITVHVNEFRSIVVQNPDDPTDRRPIPGKGPEEAVLALVRGEVWLLFPRHQNRGLPLRPRELPPLPRSDATRRPIVGGPQSPSIKQAWDDENIEVYYIAPDGKRKDLFDDNT